VCKRWNAARAFAAYLDAHPQLYQNQNVIELGAGGGLPGIVAALNGANTVCLQEFTIVAVITDTLRSC
jgi:nicotinamide N-methyltransferase